MCIVLWMVRYIYYVRDAEFTAVQFSASTSLTAGLTLSSAPQSPDITRLVNLSLTSTEAEFERDLETQLWEVTDREKIIADSGSY